MPHLHGPCHYTGKQRCPKTKKRLLNWSEESRDHAHQQLHSSSRKQSWGRMTAAEISCHTVTVHYISNLVCPRFSNSSVHFPLQKNCCIWSITSRVTKTPKLNPTAVDQPKPLALVAHPCRGDRCPARCSISSTQCWPGHEVPPWHVQDCWLVPNVLHLLNCSQVKFSW